MRGRRAFGLRPRLLAALVLTAAVTWRAALALLGPLEQRLRTDGEQSVLIAVTDAKPRFGRPAPRSRHGLPRRCALAAP